MFLNITIDKKAIIILAASVFMCNFANAKSCDKKSPFYARIDAGLSQPSEKLDNNNTYYNQKLLRSEFYGAGIGYIFNKNIRSDLTLTGRTNYKFSFDGSYDGDNITANQQISSTTLMLNTYYNAPVNEIFSPYVNVGLGLSRISMGDYSSNYNAGDFTVSSGSNSNYDLAWNVGFGLQSKLTNDFSFDTFFRFIDLGKTKTQSMTVSNSTPDTVSPFLLQSYETGISLIYRF
ncbi:MAG: outer membrane beta-barrel protein [Rickettsiales bacterium]|jgi:opacity protein-like surface antigen|nr:outer membrane beta-barrel protein [Rickettsiales bacterium]